MPDHYASSPRAWTMIVQSPTECVVGTGHGLAILAKPYSNHKPSSVGLFQDVIACPRLQQSSVHTDLLQYWTVETTVQYVHATRCRNNTSWLTGRRQVSKQHLALIGAGQVSKQHLSLTVIAVSKQHRSHDVAAGRRNNVRQLSSPDRRNNGLA